MPTPARVIERALSRVERQGDCIVSLYSTGNHGYAQIGWHESAPRKTQMRLVHRVAWEATHGPIPAGMTVDHICHNRKCLRIDHLRLLSNVDNGRRNAPGRDFPVGWMCKRGHPESSLMQVRRRKGLGWTCRDCQRIAHQKWELARNPNYMPRSQRTPASKELGADDPRHGTASGYTNHRCRCDLCTRANKEMKRTWTAKKRATND